MDNKSKDKEQVHKEMEEILEITIGLDQSTQVMERNQDHNEDPDPDHDQEDPDHDHQYEIGAEDGGEGWVQRCENCQRYGHMVRDCVGPVDMYGYINGCLHPRCNTTGHTWDDCPEKGKSPSEARRLLGNLRQGLAMFRLHHDIRNYDWFEELDPKPIKPQSALALQSNQPTYWEEYIYTGDVKKNFK